MASRVPQNLTADGVTRPVAHTAAYGPTSNNIVGPDNIIQGRLPYRRAAGSAHTTDPAFRSKQRVIIPNDGKSFAAPPL